MFALHASAEASQKFNNNDDDGDIGTACGGASSCRKKQAGSSPSFDD